MSRKELVYQHGMPKYVSPAMKREVQQWIRASQVITSLDYEVAQAAVRSQMRKS